MEYITFAPVASFIFAITIATSLLAFSNENLYGKMMLHPYSVYRKKYVYTLLTSGLIHKDWMHLFFNMLSYYFFAFQLEVYIGHWQFGLLYIASLILSDLPSVAKHKNDFWYNSLGASGAVSAVVFSYIMYSPMTRLMIMPLPIPIPAILFGVLYMVYCSYASRYSKDNINHDAHLFGALCGIAITIILNPKIVPIFLHQISGGVQSILH
ncbi:rhomboid family intramembrane serine protease [Mucilaginibacter sp.]|uniref:rhomboid family intramembrane serine protease n=1 Tax=Mucilaginibacter sp. TaxID=1882438 RepID=UPI00262115B8|nr:rhomboid family intramembrane serine protease [Mucilaginibacter sp.]MDB4924459.1 rhomboid family intrarane serine protease [Mucilaginibacter sp.]